MLNIEQKLKQAQKHGSQSQAGHGVVRASMNHLPVRASGSCSFRECSLVEYKRVLSATAMVFAATMIPWFNAAGQTPAQAINSNAPWQTATGEISRFQGATRIAATLTFEPFPVRKTNKAPSREAASPERTTDTAESGQSDIRDPAAKAASTDNRGPWVINLASLSSKADADRLVENARSRNIETETLQVTVKGKQYWRVQITGFSTAAEARAYTGTAREKLGLKDVWVMKR